MFISLSSTCIQNFSNWHALFVFFLSHCVAVVAWSGVQRVDPQMIPFEVFYQLVHRSQFNPQTIFVLFRQQNKKYFRHSSKKDDHCGPFHSNAFVLLYKSETSRMSGGIFCHLLLSGLFS